MLRGLALLLVFQSLGEVAVRASGTVVPGPVVGMVLLFIFLVVRKDSPRSLTEVADGLLSHLAIFYIPAAVGVMLYAKPLAEQGIAWIAAILLSTLGAMLLPALLLKRWLGNEPEASANGEPPSDAPVSAEKERAQP